MNEAKDANPKDAVGIRKVTFSVLPWAVIAELGLALLEGARKYGRHNWRVAGVRASVYFDANFRHMTDWWEGVDIDKDSGLSHVTKAIASLTVLRDSMIQGNWIDDRPPPSPPGWLEECNRKAAEIIDRYPDAKEPFVANRLNPFAANSKVSDPIKACAVCEGSGVVTTGSELDQCAQCRGTGASV